MPDGCHVRTIGSHGSGNGQLNSPNGGIAIDSDGRMVVADTSNHHVQVFVWAAACKLPLLPFSPPPIPLCLHPAQ